MNAGQRSGLLQTVAGKTQATVAFVAADRGQGRHLGRGQAHLLGFGHGLGLGLHDHLLRRHHLRRGTGVDDVLALFAREGFEAAAVITVLVLLGQVLELRARSRTSAAIRKLLALAPAIARRVGADGTETDVPLEHVRVGELAGAAVLCHRAGPARPRRDHLR